MTQHKASWLPLCAAVVGALVAGVHQGCSRTALTGRPLEQLAARKASTPQVCTLVSGVASTQRHVVVEGGGLDGAQLPITSHLVKAHGYLFLVDAGLVGEAQRPGMSVPIEAVMGFHGSTSALVARQLAEAGIPPARLDFIALTHAHLDHAGELEAFPGVPVVMAPEELEWINSLPATARDLTTWRREGDWNAMQGRIRPLRWTADPGLPNGKGMDLFGDGSVVFMHTPGHTPGSMSILLAGPGTAGTLLLGDVTLSSQHVRQALHKGPLGNMLDEDRDTAWKTVNAVHAYTKPHPEWDLRPAHDELLLRHRYAFAACAKAMLASAAGR